jgi:DNA/RNA-binding domain of Phe-tRNA-synthetase-like protein
MKVIHLESTILTAAPSYCGCLMECDVVNSLHDTDLWEELEQVCAQMQRSYRLEDVTKRSGILEMRLLYRKLGKDPNRYRPSAEALTRRVLQNKPIYPINTLVDLINLVSLQTGFSIGGFDASKVQGNLVFGVGEAGERFEGIGRGLLNIEGLPVYRDELGGIGTPTSDEERTKLLPETTRLLMVIHSAGGDRGLEAAVELSVRLLERFANARNIEIKRF